jgi:hypothetical protein
MPQYWYDFYMPGPDRPSFGRRNVPPKPKTGHEALVPPSLTARVVHDTLYAIPNGQLHQNLKNAIAKNPDLRARAAEIALLVSQGREKDVTQESLQALNDALRNS